MKKIIKWLLLLAGSALTVAFVFFGGKYIAIRRDPSRAFAKASALPAVTPFAQNVSQKNPRPLASPAPTPRPAERSASPIEPITYTPPAATPVAPALTPAANPIDSSFAGSGDVIALALLGIDTTPERERKKMGWRSDSIAVCVINLAHKTATIITVPRDTRARVQKLDSKGRVIGARMDKINAAYAYGGGAQKHSNQNAIAALSELLDMDVRYYASIDMDSIAPLADSMGGVELTLEDTVPGVGKKGETVLLKGDKAVRYVRRRKGITGGSDVARAKRQQLFFKAAAMKLKSMGPLSAVPVVLSAMGSRVRTNLSIEQILALATVLRQTEESSIEFITLPGKARTISGVSYYIADPPAVKAISRRTWGAGEKEAVNQ